MAAGHAWVCGVGSLLAGFYGILHDQVTYSISNEYFTRLKFPQFHYANFGLSHRVFVAEIGFLATWLLTAAPVAFAKHGTPPRIELIVHDNVRYVVPK
jgi:hypothetical protein